MNGAESLIRTALAAGVEVCFANPGTTEMPLVAALDAIPGMRSVLGLFEGVCTRAADAPLTSDIVSLANPVSGWVREVKSATSLAADTATAIAAAGRAPGKVATLIVPSDCQWSPAGDAAPPLAIAALPQAADSAISKSAEMLGTHGANTLLFMGAQATRDRGLRAAARIAAKTGCRLMCETFPARIERGGALPFVEKLPYFPEQATEALAKSAAFILAGALAPIAFFGYPNSRS